MARTAVNDTDDRVQASAVEVMDELDLPDRAPCTEPLLTTRNHRLRANAIKSMLTMASNRAGESLLDMLEDASPAHRISGLWVVGRLMLRSTRPNVQALAAGDSDARVRRQAQIVLDRLRGAGTAAAQPSAIASIGGGP